MSKRADQLRAIGIYNMRGIASDGQPMLWLRTPCRWMVLIENHLIPNRPWYDHGAMGFSYISKEDELEAKAKALAWIAERFPDAEMVPCPFGRSSYVTKADLDAALAKVKGE